jgi:DnaJ-class molecular chaperone
MPPAMPDCPRCNGSGKMPDHSACPDCNGTGKKPATPNG